MAITLHQEPSGWVFGRSNPIIYTASSTNVANTGFRFVFEVEIAGETNTFQVPPNASNRAIFDVQKVLKPYLGPRLAGNDASQSSIHELGASTATLHLNELASNNATKPVQLVSVVVKEGWIIAGVFTPTATGQATSTFVVQNIAYPSNRFEFNKDHTLLSTTDRNEYVGLREFDMATTYGLNVLGDVFIPTQTTDKGIISFITDDGTYHSIGVADYVIRGVIVEEDGTTTTKEISITGAAGQITHFGCYPYNLGASSIGASFFNPNDYPNYRYYTISLHDDTNPAKPLRSYRYVFFNQDYHQKYDLQGYVGNQPQSVQVAWLNDQGFYDYFNFNYKSEYTQKVERKTMQKILGSFTGTTYSVNQYDRGLAHTSVNAERVITMTSKKLDTWEFRLISSLLRSTDVYLLTDLNSSSLSTASIIPVVIETADNIEHRPLDSKARDITIIAREAHPVI